MKKLILVSSIIAVTSFMQLSQAKTGDINFTGSLTAATCSATAPGSTANNINVPMGIVSIADLEDGSTGQASTTTQLQLDINCTGATDLSNAHMSFDPVSGSGLDADDTRLLKINTGGATGVGIALLDSSDTILNLGAGDRLTTALIVDGTGAATAKLDLRAAYIKNGTPLAAGTANANMPFTFIYD